MTSYKERVDIFSGLGLYKIETFTRTIKRINCNCNTWHTFHLAQYLLSNIPSKTKVVCPCGYHLNTQNVTLNVDVNFAKFGFMQQVIDNGHITQWLCQKCRKIENEIEYDQHVIIDTTVLTQIHNQKRRSSPHT